MRQLQHCWSYLRGDSLFTPSVLEGLYESRPDIRAMSSDSQRELIYQELTEPLFSRIGDLTARLNTALDGFLNDPNDTPIRSHVEDALKWLDSIDTENAICLAETLRRGSRYEDPFYTSPQTDRSCGFRPKTSEATDDVKSDLRSTLLEAFADGMSEKDLSALRVRLAANFDLTPIQVSSIGAYLKIHGDKILSENGLSDHDTSLGERLTPRHLAFACRYLMLSPEDSESALREISKEFDLLPNTVALILSEYAKRNRFELPELSAAKQASTPVLESETIRSISTVEPRLESVTGEGGAYADYDNPTKVRWRECWFDFLERSVPQERRRDSKVLCLPSIEPAREVSGYLRLGFSPENIYAVERDRRSAALFEERCRELGVNPIIGDLETIVPRLDRRFEVISLDFLGPLSVVGSKIFNHLPMAEETYLLVNVMGRREQKEIQESLRYLGKVRNSALDIRDEYFLANQFGDEMLEVLTKHPAAAVRLAELVKEAGLGELSSPSDLDNIDHERMQREFIPALKQIPEFAGLVRMIEGMREKQEYTEERSLPEMRETELIHFLIGTIGNARNDILGYTPATSRNLDISTGCCNKGWDVLNYQEKLDHLRKTGPNISGFLSSQLFKSYPPAKRFNFPEYTAMNILYIGCTLIPKLRDSQIVRYESPVSFARTPYHTVHMRLENPIKLRQEMFEAYRFVEKIALEMVQLPVASRMTFSGFHVFLSSDQLQTRNLLAGKHLIAPLGSGLKSDRWISVWREDSGEVRHIASIQAGALLKSFQRMHEYLMSVGNSNEVAEQSRVIEL